MPLISGGGGTFNGGTITNPLVVDTSATPGVNPLRLVHDNGSWTFDEGNNRILGVGVGGFSSSVRLTETDLPGVLTSLDSGGGIVVQNDGSGLQSAKTDGTPVAALIAYLGVRLTLHAAPADADLNAGDCALWFDQTNGASALKVKAKTANGTVATATVPLT